MSGISERKEVVILLELIFQGFFEWIYSLILECWNFFFSSLLDIMTLDFAYIKTHVPIVEDISQILLAVGWALLLGNLVFQAIRSMVSGLGFEGEDPKLLFARTFVFSFLLLASPQICEIGLNLTSRIMALLEIPDALNVQLVDDGLFGTLTAAWLLVIIFDIIIMFMVLKLLMEVAERYVILAVLSITAPLAFSMGGSKSTAEIFTGWCRMFGSMCLLMVTNVMFFKMLLSVVSTIPSGLDVFPWMVLIVSIVKVAKKADEIITRIGLNPAITGDKGKGFGSILAHNVLRTAAVKAVKVLGAAVTGGGSAAAGAVAGGIKGVAGAAGAAGAAGVAGMAGTAGAAGTATRSGAGRRGAAQSPGSSQEQPTGTAQTGGAGETSRGPSGTGSPGGSASRRTSAPTGARRGASHVTGGGQETSGFTPGGSVGGGAGRASGGFSGRAEPFGGTGGEYGGGASRRTVGRSGKPADGTTEPFGGTGGAYGGGASRGTLRHSGKLGGGAARQRGVDVYVGDDFDDGYVGTGGKPINPGTPSGVSPAGGAGRRGAAAFAGTTPESANQSRGRSSAGESRRGSPAGRTGTRSTQRHGTAPKQTAQQHSAAGTAKVISSQKVTDVTQRSSGMARQEFGRADTSTGGASRSGVRRPIPTDAPRSGVRRPGPAGTMEGTSGSKADSSKRQKPAVQKTAKAASPAGIAAKGEAAMARPGRAGTAGGSARVSYSKYRSPSPARQRVRDTLTRGGPPSIHPGLAGTGSSRQTPSSERRSPSPIRQESRQAPAPTETSVKGSSSVAHPGGAGTAPSRQTPPSERRSSSPARQEPRQTSTPTRTPAKGGAPLPRPGPAGTSSMKGQLPPQRTTQRKPNQGGSEHGKPGS